MTVKEIRPGMPQRVIDKINEIIQALNDGGEGGGGLPEVTAADNGDVLTVVDGAWAKAEPSGGLSVETTITTETIDGHVQNTITNAAAIFDLLDAVAAEPSLAATSCVVYTNDGLISVADGYYSFGRVEFGDIFDLDTSSNTYIFFTSAVSRTDIAADGSIVAIDESV